MNDVTEEFHLGERLLAVPEPAAATTPPPLSDDAGSSDPGASPEPVEAVTSPGRRMWWTPAAVPLVCGVFSLFVVLIAAGRRQLWRDEFATLDAARMGLRDLYALVQHKDLVLLPYYLGMHFWVRLVGDTEVALRLPSAIAVAIAAAMTAWQGRMLYGPRAGLLAGLLFGLLPVVSRYGQEARPYGLAIAAVSVAGAFLVRATQRQSRLIWICYALSLVLIGWLHLIALVVLPAHGLLVALHARRTRSWPLAAWWLGATATAAAALAPLILLAKAQSAQINWIQPVPVAELSEWILGLPGSVGVGGILLGLAVLGCVTGGPRAGYLVAWALGPLVLLWALTPVMRLFTERYVLFVLPAWCLLAAAGVQVATRRLNAFTVAVPTLVLLVGLSSHVAVRGSVTEYESDLRAAAAVIERQERAGDLLAFSGPFPWWAYAGTKYYLPEHPQLAQVFQAVEGQKTPTYQDWCGATARCLDTRARIWLINTKHSSTQLSSYAGMDPEVEKALRARFVVDHVDRFTNVSVSLLTPRPRR